MVLVMVVGLALFFFFNLIISLNAILFSHLYTFLIVAMTFFSFCDCGFSDVSLCFQLLSFLLLYMHFLSRLLHGDGFFVLVDSIVYSFFRMDIGVIVFYLEDDVFMVSGLSTSFLIYMQSDSFCCQVMYLLVGITLLAKSLPSYLLRQKTHSSSLSC